MQIAKIISSRFFFLALGVFLASAVAVYATWGDAQSSGGSLTEANWNASVAMHELGTGCFWLSGNGTSELSGTETCQNVGATCKFVGVEYTGAGASNITYRYWGACSGFSFTSQVALCCY